MRRDEDYPRRYYRQDDSRLPAIATGAAIGGLMLLAKKGRVDASKIRSYGTRAANSKFYAASQLNRVKDYQRKYDLAKKAKLASPLPRLKPRGWFKKSPEEAFLKAEKDLRNARRRAADAQLWAKRDSAVNKFKMQTQNYTPGLGKQLAYIGGGALVAGHLAKKADRRRQEQMYGPNQIDQD